MYNLPPCLTDGRATWKGHLAGFLFLCHDSERMYTYRIDPLHKRRPLCLMTSPRWRPIDPSSWKSSSPWVICDPVPSPPCPDAAASLPATALNTTTRDMIRNFA